MVDSFAGEEEEEVEDTDSPAWAKTRENEMEEEEGSSESDGSLEFVDSPTHSSTGLKKKRRSRTDKMAKTMAKELGRVLEKSGTGEGGRGADMEMFKAFTNSLVQGLNRNEKRKGEEKEYMPESKILIDEQMRVKDDGHKVVAWKLRNMLRPLNGDPGKYWQEGSWETEVRPVLGTNLFLTHLFPLSINPKTIRAVYDSKKVTEIKHYSCKNRTSISAKKKLRKVVMETKGDGQEMDVMSGINWEGCEGVKDVMEGIFNMAALEFSIRPHSYQALVLLRVLHEVGYGQNYVSTAFEQKNLIESFVNEVLMRNANRAISGDGPLVYKEAKGVFEEIYDTTIEGQEKKAGKHDVYSEFARARKCEAALAVALAEKNHLRRK